MSETVEQQFIREGRDQMGYDLAPVMGLFTAAEIDGAKAIAKAHGFKWDCVGRDPRVMGWRFLRDAKIAMSGIDLGDRCPVRG
jgi:hypothetical protein